VKVSSTVSHIHIILMHFYDAKKTYESY